MGLLSFLKRNPTSRADSGAKGETLPPGDAVAQARARARRRLIGAALLLGIGVIGFPLLFETQPRPIPIDVSIEIPAKDKSPPLAMPTARATKPAPAATPAPTVAPPVPAVTSTPTPAATQTVPPETVARAAPAADEGAKARALLEGQAATATAATKSGPSANGRFVIQVGAFAEATSAREVRKKVEKLGLKTYTQVVQIDGARRIRVRAGPYPTREEADRAAGQIKSAGLQASILPL